MEREAGRGRDVGPHPVERDERHEQRNRHEENGAPELLIRVDHHALDGSLELLPARLGIAHPEEDTHHHRRHELQNHGARNGRAPDTDQLGQEPDAPFEQDI